ncbi:MAG TPA: hypothetical protein VF554_02090 [Thermoanaerobaculia bacterium]
MEKLPRRVLAARVIAVLADAVQIGFLPLFAGGAPEGFDAVLDVAVGATMVALVGWHWAFLPAFAAELVPVVDLAPTWTLAVLLATRRTGRSGGPVEVTRVEPPLLPPAGR